MLLSGHPSQNRYALAALEESVLCLALMYVDTADCCRNEREAEETRSKIMTTFISVFFERPAHLLDLFMQATDID